MTPAFAPLCLESTHSLAIRVASMICLPFINVILCLLTKLLTIFLSLSASNFATILYISPVRLVILKFFNSEALKLFWNQSYEGSIKAFLKLLIFMNELECLQNVLFHELQKSSIKGHGKSIQPRCLLLSTKFIAF